MRQVSDSSTVHVAPQGRWSVRGALAIPMLAHHAGFVVRSTTYTHWFPSCTGREGPLLLEIKKQRSAPGEHAVGYPSLEDTIAGSQASIAKAYSSSPCPVLALV